MRLLFLLVIALMLMAAPAKAQHCQWGPVGYRFECMRPYHQDWPRREHWREHHRWHEEHERRDWRERPWGW